MFARRVCMHLKPKSVAEFTRRLEKDILPMLRKQKGFQDESRSLRRAGRKRSQSVCGTKPRMPRLQTAELTRSDKNPRHGSEGAPQVETYDVANSTFHRIAAAAA